MHKVRGYRVRPHWRTSRKGRKFRAGKNMSEMNIRVFKGGRVRITRITPRGRFEKFTNVVDLERMLRGNWGR